ncbi:RNA-binding protein 6 isoform X1 [Pseudonaja textilis]|uniref:RNA binding motif protein 6 n=1 Tax=Pseudonaja textilis TaxID=8673 RepID=A0A670YJ76_PSETE|nr:RNA-binding protein 6 isoform X1 [Pseudonaja textilis]
MWGHPHSTNRMGPFRGSQEERFAPGWNRDYSPPLDSLAQERHSGNFSGRESLPFDIQGLPGILNPQFANREESTFSFGGRDGPHSDFRGGEGHMHDFESRDYSPSDFQSRDDSQLDFRARVPLLPDFRGREMYPGTFQDREGQAVEYSGGDVPPMDYRNRDTFRMNYRDREAHTVNYRSRDDTSSDCRTRGTSDLDFRNRDGSHPHFRARDMPEQDYRGREQPYSDFRKRDVPDTDLRNMGAADSDFRDRDIAHSNFRNRAKPQADQDFRGRDAPPPLDFAERETLSADSNVVDYHHRQSPAQLADRECKIEETVVVRDRSSLSIQNEDLPHSESRAREEEKPQEQNLKTESSLEYQNSRNPLPKLLDQDKPAQGFVSNQEISAKEEQVAELPGLKEKSDLDFLGRQDTDYRGIEYRDVDHRLPGCRVFDYEHGKTFADGKSCKDSQPDLQDQDYRTCLKDTKPSKLIRLGRVPETATKDDILNAFQACDGTPVKNLRLKDYTTGYNYGYICVEFSLLEEAIACMEANQGHLMIGGKQVTLEYSPYPEFWYCKRCKARTVGFRSEGYRSSCYFCKLPRDVTEEKLEKEEEELPEEPSPKGESVEDPTPSQELPPQKPDSELQCPPQEFEPKKKDKNREEWLPQEKKRDLEMYPPRKENQDRGSRRESVENKRQEDESKTIMLKRIPRFTPPEVIVGLLAPYVRLSTSSVRVMKNKAGRMGYTYGFIELDSHAEARRLVKVLQDLDPPISIDGRAVDVNLATGKRRNEYGDQGDISRFNQGKRGMNDRRSTDTQKRKSESSSDMSTFIYDPDTGNYFDPISGVYYDSNTQREIPMGREASPPLSSMRHYKSQERTSERDEPSSRDNRRERHRNKSAKNEHQEDKFSAEDVFKKPLPPILKKEESTPPPKVVNPLIGLLGEYGGDSDNEEEEEEEPQPQPSRPVVQQEERPQKVESDEAKLTDWNKLACLLCRRQFPNKEVLIKHQQLSNLHKQNLEIHWKIKRSEQELAYLEKREREGKYKEKGNDRRERFEERESPERKRPKYFRNSDSERKSTDKGRMESNNKGSRMMQAMGWKEGSGLGRNEQGMTSPLEAENRKKGAGLGTQGRPSRRQSNETYRDAVRRVMFARYKELE